MLQFNLTQHNSNYLRCFLEITGGGRGAGGSGGDGRSVSLSEESELSLESLDDEEEELSDNTPTSIRSGK